ncbi:MAG: pentapeptide repeat-containing protein [Saprospiraceae bacterium]|nr:pentapeptide repeat-containing protein [Saprospiraceae bacterium]
MLKHLKIISGIIGMFLIVGAVLYCWPYILEQQAFVLGFLSCSLLFLFFHFINSRLVSTEKHKSTSFYILIIGMALCVGIIAIIRQIDYSSTIQQAHLEALRSIEENKLVAAQNSNWAKACEAAINSCQEDLITANTISESSIRRIASLSARLKPYHLYDDSLKHRLISPERGELLMAILSLDMDSTSLLAIRNNTDFSYADLRGRNLDYTNLSGIKLPYAILDGATFNKANLSFANLEGASCKNARFDIAYLDKINFRNADLSWVKMSGASLQSAELNGINLSNAKLSNSNFQNAKIEFSNLKYAIADSAIFIACKMHGTDLSFSHLQQSNFEKSDLKYVKFNSANCTNANLANCNLRAADFHNTILTNATMHGSNVKGSSWLDHLTLWEVVGASDIQNRYILESDTSFATNYFIKSVID